MKKLLCLLLTLFMLLSLITACTNHEPDSEETTPEESTSTEATSEEESTSEAPTSEETSPEESESSSEEETSPEESEFPSEEETSTDEEEPISYIPLVLDDTPVATVVYPTNYTSYELTSAKKLVQCVRRLCGVELVMTDDSTPAVEGTFEVLIGSTSRQESIFAEGSLGDTEHAIFALHDKLVIHGRTEGTMAYAVDQVIQVINEIGYNGAVVVPDVFGRIGHAGLLTSELFLYDGLKYDLIRDTGDHTYLIRFANTTVENFTNYLAMLGEHGFHTIDGCAILNNTDNLYTMLSDGERAVTVIYTAYNGTATVLVESAVDNGYMDFLDADYESEPTDVCEPLMIQIGLHPAGGARQNGMSYIFRLANGKFVIFDGGWSDELFPAGQNGKRIYETLKQYAPDVNDIHIAAWLITHAHTDHIGGLDYFVKNYLPSDHITLENIIFNFPSYELVATPSHENSQLPEKLANYRDMLQKAASTGTNLCKAHAGQVYEIAGFELEIIFSYDLLYPKALSNFNNSSVCSRVTVEGQTYIFVGDSANDANIVMNDMYGAGLKCDFFQVPHHGYGPNDPTFLTQVKPTWLLWPVSAKDYNSTKNNAHVQLFFAADTTVESIYVSAYQNHIFELPFDGTNVTVIPLTAIPE